MEDLSLALEFQLNRNTVELYKNFLEILEDLQSQHETSVSNLRKALVSTQERIRRKHGTEIFLEPIAAQANYFDSKLFQQLRKRVLDKGNECVKLQKEEVLKFEIKKVKGELNI